MDRALGATLRSSADQRIEVLAGHFRNPTPANTKTSPFSAGASYARAGELSGLRSFAIEPMKETNPN
jgi:hypothetical protein